MAIRWICCMYACTSMIKCNICSNKLVVLYLLLPFLYANCKDNEVTFHPLSSKVSSSSSGALDCCHGVMIMA
jgi:Flp pilus assembly protein protease CpaA